MKQKFPYRLDFHRKDPDDERPWEDFWSVRDAYGVEFAKWVARVFQFVRIQGHAVVSCFVEDGREHRLPLPVPCVHPPEGQALRDDIFAAPDDDAPRLVYADWLQQRGDPRGELIALQIGAPDHPRTGELLAEHAIQWRCDDGLPLGSCARFRRGFVEELELRGLTLAQVKLLRATPAIACLRLFDA